MVLTRTRGARARSRTRQRHGDPRRRPFGTVVMLANAPAAATRGLLAGDIVTTGSCSGAPRLPGPGTYRAEFARSAASTSASRPSGGGVRFARQARAQRLAAREALGRPVRLLS